ncbi:cytochrome P450 2K6 isoform X2 [Calypte anna]|uniref:cytochrome P450 2K6 isoform X2 n=1 Tax=Calypte anna TaxID=9244 RepID=UPI0011C44D82|nr:cytochrome P450 2K6 isoform X2 [Calypte anna]
MDWVSLVPVALLFILILLMILKGQHAWKSHARENFPPGPRPLPIIGNLHIMNLKKPHLTMLELSKTHGSVFSIQMGLRKTVVLSGYETVKEALVNQADAFAGRPKLPVFEEVSKGKGVIFSAGENWKVMRRFTLTTLRDFGMGKKAVEDRVVEEYGCLADTIESHKGKPIEMTLMVNAAVANVIVSILLGKRYDYEDPTFKRLLELVNKSMRIVGRPSVLEKGKANGYFDNENLTEVVRNLFVAGMETTSTTLLWGLLLMMKYPEIQRKVQEEIEQVIGSNPPRIEHRIQMPYTDAVIHEIQRFANIVPLNLPHETTADVTLKGYFIPKGTYIIPLLASVLRDKSHWEKPDNFYPEHFLDSEGKFVKKEAFIPFSAGRRSCAGETLAKMELFLFFTSLLQRFTFQPPPGVSITDLDLSPAAGGISSPVTYEVCAVPRS